MTDEQIKKICDYIKTHKPQASELKTIDTAIMAVTGNCNAATREDLVNKDDAWLVPDEERKIFAGVKGAGWAEAFTSEVIAMIQEAVLYSKEYFKDNTKSNDITELKEMKDMLINNINKGKDSFEGNYKRK